VPPEGPLESWEGCTAVELARHWRLPAVHLFRVVGSTNDLARRLAAAGAAAGTMVIAEEQRAGRGRAGRSWESPAGLGLWCSFVMRPASAAELRRLPVLIGVAVAEALDVWSEVGPVLVKWPNDLLITGRKLGGILCEAGWEGAEPAHVVAGIGLNLLQDQSDFPLDIRPTAVSLRVAAGAPISRHAVASALVGAVRPIVLGPGDSLAIPRPRLQARDALLGRRVEVLEPGSGTLLLSGIAAGINAEGCLCVDTAGGTVTVGSGTVRTAGEG
jgi:BirA family transcriptional regulator, biotin operon repressor / biotin---[acetyl-CoA-carboxylase] ligase